MQDPFPITPLSRPLIGRIRPPGSKSLTNRALIVGAMAAGQSSLSGVLESVDTQVMLDSLARLGIPVERNRDAGSILIQGAGGTLPASSAELRLENSGTSIRFLTALCTLGNGTFTLDGNARMRQRPIGDLVRALNALGADVRCDDDNDCPPLSVVGDGLPGGTATVAGSISSQYLSALLMTAPCAQDTVEIRVEGTLVSRPYVDMTLDVMAQFGVDADEVEEGTFRIDPQVYEPREYEIEPDASAASYFFRSEERRLGHER